MPVQAVPPPDKFVRTANYYLRAGPDIPPSDYASLARYDLLVLPMEAQAANQDFFTYARRVNPSIVILAYVPTRSINPTNLPDGVGLRQILVNEVEQRNWYLRTPPGEKISPWFGTWSVNVTTPWQKFLPLFVNEKIKAAGWFDGVFYDEVDAGGISWLSRGEIDLDNDRQKDVPGIADAQWRQSMTELFKRTRDLVGPNWLILVNGSSAAEYQPWINGRLFEDFPTPWEGNWAYNMANYVRPADLNQKPFLSTLNASTQNSGVRTDYRRMRLGLTSTLLHNGFFAFDHGTENHGQLWWYDEYNVRLGYPAGRAQLISDPQRVLIDVPGIWLRDYERGRALVNSTDHPVEVRLGGIFDQIQGQQDARANAGGRVSSIVVPPHDGRILLRPLERLTDVPFVNGAFIKLYDDQGQEKRSGFFSVEPNIPGGTLVVRLASESGIKNQPAIIAALGNKIEVRGGDGTTLASFFPFTDRYRGGLSFAVCNFEGKGDQHLLVGAARGGGPHVRMFNLDGSVYRSGFFAFARSQRGGVQVACADVTGDGRDDIIVGAGVASAPEVKIFDPDARMLKRSFLAFGAKQTAGVYVAATDIDGDGKAEIITSAGPGGGAEVRIFSAAGKERAHFDPFGERRTGVPISASDIDGDGRPEILVMTTELF